jgi:hypothetical protein
MSRAVKERAVSYASLLQAYPTAVLTAQTVIIQLLASVIVTVAKKQEVKLVQVATVALTGGLYMNPVLRAWVEFCHRCPRMGSFTKLALDQFAFSIFFTAGIVIFRSIVSCILFESGSIEKLQAVRPMLYETSKTLFQIVPVAWCYWIPVRFYINAHVPPHLTLLVNSCFSFFWIILFNLIL